MYNVSVNAMEAVNTNKMIIKQPLRQHLEVNQFIIQCYMDNKQCIMTTLFKSSKLHIVCTINAQEAAILHLRVIVNSVDSFFCEQKEINQT